MAFTTCGPTRQRSEVELTKWSPLTKSGAVIIGVGTVAQLMDHLKARGDGFARAFADPAQIRAAVNQETARPGDPVGPHDEVAFFPPMTGGRA